MLNVTNQPFMLSAVMKSVILLNVVVPFELMRQLKGVVLDDVIGLINFQITK